MATCAEPLRLVPGPQGPAGTNGTNGTPGANAVTTLTAAFTMPASAATAVATVGDTSWIVLNQPVHLQSAGTLLPTAIGSATSVTLQNPAGYTNNVAAGTVIPTGSRLAPGGRQGPSGAGGAAGSGVSVTTVGDLQTHDGTNPARLAKGTNGQLLVSDAAAGTDLAWKTIVPNASATTDNLIAVANTPLGTELPAPLQFLATARVTDTGAHQTVGGNARGIDAVDHQPARSAASQVASGDNSTISGGRNNTASAQGATVAGGDGNVASGLYSAVGGGQSNDATGTNSSVVAGNGNLASASESFVGGGTNNTASALNSAVLAGGSNTASGVASAVLSGSSNVASGQGSVAFGESNSATATDASALGGASNTASAASATIVGGFQGNAYLFGQVAHASGRFVASGDAQTSELVWKGTTTDATANVEIFIGPASQRAVVPNNTTWGFHIILTARRSNGDSFIYEAKGGIKNDAGNTVMVAAITEAVLADGTGGVLTTASVDVDADNPNDSLRIRVTGVAAQTWRWVAHGRLVECGH